MKFESKDAREELSLIKHVVLCFFFSAINVKVKVSPGYFGLVESILPPYFLNRLVRRHCEAKAINDHSMAEAGVKGSCLVYN